MSLTLEALRAAGQLVGTSNPLPSDSLAAAQAEHATAQMAAQRAPRAGLLAGVALGLGGILWWQSRR